MEKFNPVVNDPVEIDKHFPPSMMPIIFSSEGSKLLGTYFLANGSGPHPLVILLHGFPGNESNFDLAHALRRAGLNVFIFHYRGSWGSKGYFSWNNVLQDVENAIDFIRTKLPHKIYRTDPDKIILAGHSMGGFATAITSTKVTNIENIMMITPFNFGGFAKFMEDKEEIKSMALERLAAGTNLVHGTSPELLWEEWQKNKAQFDLLTVAQKLADKNVLLIGARFDSTAPPELHYSPFEQALKIVNPRQFESHLLNSGHSFANQRIKLAELIVNWANKIKF